MLKNRYVIIGLATLAAFLTSSLYYSPVLVGNIWRAVDPVATAASTPSPWMVLAEVLRTILITWVLEDVSEMCGVKSWKQFVSLGLWLWFGFSAMMWAGAVLWEKTPWQIAVIHSGDWLLKTVVVMSMLSLRVGRTPQPHTGHKPI